jgi:primosomal protein N' (replication factor Y)
LESWANVQAGKYQLDVLTKRVDDKKLPDIHVVDMRIEIVRQRGLVTLSRLLVDHMHRRFERKEQIILFINRRGYSSSMQCRKCGHVEQCPHCSVSMTYHRADETLKCHLCGHARGAPAVCPACAAPDIRWRGLGTQRVEEAVRRVLPRARLERMDADTMAKKHLFRQILGDFRAGKIDVLIGTQMIGKGLDFPNVTLVGLVDADLSMHVPDFRANERTFQLLVQVAGRAGRGDRAGEVVVQSFTPKSEAIQFARQADYNGFAEGELAMRKKFNYPPYRHLIHHIFRGPNQEKIKFFAEHWVKQVEQALGGIVEIRGPAPAPIEKVKDEYRYQIWYFCARTTAVVPALVRLQGTVKWPDDVIQVLDVDPMSLV